MTHVLSLKKTQKSYNSLKKFNYVTCIKSKMYSRTKQFY